MLTFHDTYNDSQIYSVNDRYIHFHTPDQLIKYYANYFEYKRMPTFEQFKADEAEQIAFHEAHQQSHRLFIFPDHETIPEDIMTYAVNHGYTLEHMELYTASKEGLTVRSNDNIRIERVMEEGSLLDDFLSVCREGELEYGEAFADLKERLHCEKIKQPHIIHLIAYINQQPAGKLEAIVNTGSVELDDFYVLESFRSRGVGSALQQYIWQLAGERPLLLIADGNDTARKMYQKQGYIKVSERFELLYKPQ